MYVWEALAALPAVSNTESSIISCCFTDLWVPAVEYGIAREDPIVLCSSLAMLMERYCEQVRSENRAWDAWLVECSYESSVQSNSAATIRSFTAYACPKLSGFSHAQSSTVEDLENLAAC